MWVPVRHAESLLLESGRQQLICKELIVAAYQAIRKLIKRRGMFQEITPLRWTYAVEDPPRCYSRHSAAVRNFGKFGNLLLKSLDIRRMHASNSPSQLGLFLSLLFFMIPKLSAATAPFGISIG
jgi:hypothetical protein